MPLMPVLLSFVWLSFGMFAAPAMTHWVLAKKYSAFIRSAGNDAEALQQLKDSEQGFCSTLTTRYRVVSAIVLSLSAAVLAANVDVLSPLMFAGVALELVCLFLMLVVLLCDLKARIIPRELCACIAALGGLSLYLRHGLSALAGGVVAAIVIEAIVLVTSLCARAIGPEDALGAGDLKLIAALCVCSGLEGSFTGALCCSLFMACCAAVSIALGKGKSGYLPLAPGLFIWFVVGCIMPS